MVDSKTIKVSLDKCGDIACAVFIMKLISGSLCLVKGVGTHKRMQSKSETREKSVLAMNRPLSSIEQMSSAGICLM